jgi:TolB-like protein/DNA-binding winged helix-turn-helix (wHTH) protein/Tfp pilus assembly protein PilF
MESHVPDRRRARFGQFEFDVHTGDLRRAGLRLRITGQPLRILQRLVERGSDLVTREELRQDLWSDDTFVDFDRGLNSAMKRLRAVLGDTGDHPRFIETLPKRGYRLLVPVTWQTESTGPGTGPPAATPDAGTEAPRPATRHWGRWVGAGGIGLALVAALTWSLASGPHSRPQRSLAVLPFVVAGPQADRETDEYLAFGMADALITELTRLGGVRVVSQTSSMQYRNAGKRLPDIARELGVDVVVEGAVLREGTRVRTTVQLIDATTDSHLWAHSYEHERDSVLTLARDVARTAAREVRARLTPSVSTAPAHAVDVDPRVWEAYLKGRYHVSRGNEADFARARDHFSEALAVDARHAPSHAGLADYYILNDTLDPAESLRQARTHALQALALDETLPDAHASLAFLRYYGDWNWTGAEQSFQRALELNPQHARGHRWYALFLAAMSRFEDARREVAAALQSDPVAIVNQDVAAAVAFNARRFAEAAAIGRGMVDLDAGDVRGHEHVALASIKLGDGARALQAVDRALAIAPDNVLMQAFRAMSLASVGRSHDAAAVMADLTRRAEGPHLPPAIAAMAHATIGEADLALAALERAYDVRDPYLVLVHVSPWFDPLRGHPRFERVHARLAFPQT